MLKVTRGYIREWMLPKRSTYESQDTELNISHV